MRYPECKFVIPQNDKYSNNCSYGKGDGSGDGDGAGHTGGVCGNGSGYGDIGSIDGLVKWVEWVEGGGGVRGEDYGIGEDYLMMTGGRTWE